MQKSDRVPQPEGVQHGKHQQPQPGRAGLGFPQLRFRVSVPAHRCLQMPVDAAFRAANQLSQYAQALFALDGDSGENGAAGRPDGLSRSVFFIMAGKDTGIRQPVSIPLHLETLFQHQCPGLSG